MTAVEELERVVQSLAADELAEFRGWFADFEGNRSVVRRLYDEVFVKWNFDVLDELVALEFKQRGVPPGLSGPEHFRQFYGAMRAAFPDLQFIVEDMVAEGDRVVVRWRTRATHRGEFRGILPAGGDGSTTGIAIYRLSKGKIVERWVEVDMLGLTERLQAGVRAR